jgi:leader peptidase (prepilin peptidase)/N-methyltransferase
MAGILFVLGAAVGSFLNVIALRYNPEEFIFTRKTIGGRSHCAHCKKNLRWFELVPLVSFLFQRGRCRRCGARLSLQYPLAEIVSGLIFVFVPARFGEYLFFPGIRGGGLIAVEAIFVLAFLALFLMALIDYRLELIPDEITVFLTILGIAFTILASPGFSLASGSFVGGYALLLGVRSSVYLNHAVGALAGAGFLYALYVLSRKRGIGFGDVKLALPLGLLFGWPDIALVGFFAFVAGSAYGLLAILRGGKSMKSFLAFGPFLAVGAAIVFFRGLELVAAYFKLFEL